ncbi:MAG: GAP family protein [Actinomycetota bacterium]|nr:GAP family protein [Actinomycetota bacterium]MDH4017046.1 GAP family protein [Actinomycetota bacterium]
MSSQIADMWVDLLPVLLAMTISPARTLAVILLLHTPRSTVTALSYVLGMVVAMMAQGAAMGAAMSIVGLAGSDRSADLAVVVGTLYLVGGVILIAGAVKFARAPASGGGALGAALERLEHVDPRGSFKVGFGWIFASPKQWVFVLTAVAVIYTAELRPIGSLANYLAFSILVQIAYLIIIGAYVVFQDRVSRVLDAVFEWIRANLRASATGLFAVFGIVFVIKGLSELAG